MPERYGNRRDAEEIEIESDEEEDEMQGVGRRVHPSTSRRPSINDFEDMVDDPNLEDDDDDELEVEEL